METLIPTAQMITLIATILVPILGGLVWAIHLIFDIKNDIKHLDVRMSHLEGYLQGRDKYIKQSDGTHDK